MFEVIVQPKECLHDCVLRNRWHIAGAQIFHMGHAGKNGVSLVLLPSETCPALAADKSAAQRGGIHCMLNMLFACQFSVSTWHTSGCISVSGYVLEKVQDGLSVVAQKAPHYLS